MRKVVFAVPGMEYFARGVAEVLGWEVMIGGYVGNADLCLIMGLYDPPLYRTTLEMTQRCKKRIIQWCGTDALNYQPAWDSLPDAIHTCDSPALRTELIEKDVDVAKVVTLPGFKHYPLTPLPEKKLIACYLGNNPLAYGNDMFAALGETLPDEVECMGYMNGQLNPQQMEELAASTSVYLRLTAHDGGCMSAREFAEAGRPVVISSDWPYMTRVKHDDIIGLLKATREALKVTEHDMEMVEYYREFNSNERYLRDMEEVLDLV